MWAWIGLFLAGVLGRAASVGGLGLRGDGGGCARAACWRGWLADRWNRARVAAVLHAGVGRLRVLIGPVAEAWPALALVLAFVWGFAVVADFGAVLGLRRQPLAARLCGDDADGADLRWASC